MGCELVTGETIELNLSKLDHLRRETPYQHKKSNLLISFSPGSNVAALRRRGLSLVLRDKTNKAERSTAFIKDSDKQLSHGCGKFLVHLNRGTTFHAAAKTQRSCTRLHRALRRTGATSEKYPPLCLNRCLSWQK